MHRENAFLCDLISNNPVYYPRIGVLKMTNEQIIDSLKTLKNNGISYKYIATQCSINISSMYTYINKGAFPYLMRRTIEEYINNNFRELIKENE